MAHTRLYNTYIRQIIGRRGVRERARCCWQAQAAAAAAAAAATLTFGVRVGVACSAAPREEAPLAGLAGDDRTPLLADDAEDDDGLERRSGDGLPTPPPPLPAPPPPPPPPVARALASARSRAEDGRRSNPPYASEEGEDGWSRSASVESSPPAPA